MISADNTESAKDAYGTPTGQASEGVCGAVGESPVLKSIVKEPLAVVIKLVKFRKKPLGISRREGQKVGVERAIALVTNDFEPDPREVQGEPSAVHVVFPQRIQFLSPEHGVLGDRRPNPAKVIYGGIHRTSPLEFVLLVTLPGAVEALQERIGDVPGVVLNSEVGEQPLPSDRARTVFSDVKSVPFREDGQNVLAVTSIPLECRGLHVERGQVAGPIIPTRARGPDRQD